MPQISVIVPVYNVEKYIDRCVRSILGQTYSDFELILVDDGSPDNAPAMCDEWATKDSRIRVIHKENGGLSSARNAGIQAATGEYLIFIDSDDVIHPDCLRILMTCIQNTGAEIAMGRFTRFHEENVVEDRFLPWNGECVTRNNLETLDCFFDDLENLPSLVSACGTLWHRQLFDGLTFPVGRLFEDEFTTYKLYHKSTKVVFVDAVLYYYFDNSNGITRNLTIEKRFDEYDAQWERLEYFGEHALKELQGKAAMTFLRTAQWDLIACRKNKETVSPEKRQRFEKQYQDALAVAKSLGCLDFLVHYDYFVLAYPKYTQLLRIKRRLLILVMKN